MQFSLYINQARALEWGMNAPQAMLFAFLYELPSWADPIVVNNVVHYRITKAKVIEELPLLTDKPDTVYRLMCQLRDLGVINVMTLGNQPLLMITEKGKAWNHGEGSEKYPTPRTQSDPSEKDPDKVGKKSEPGSEKNPTYQITNNQITKSGSSLRSEPRAARKTATDKLTVTCLVALGVNEQTARDHLVNRDAKRCPLTKGALDGMVQEAAKAGLSLPDAIAASVKYGWASFEAEWYFKRQPAASPSPGGSIHHGIANQDWDGAKARAVDNVGGAF